MNFISSPYYTKGEYHFLMGFINPIRRGLFRELIFRRRTGFVYLDSIPLE